jgi:hypothetical protein
MNAETGERECDFHVINPSQKVFDRVGVSSPWNE